MNLPCSRQQSEKPRLHNKLSTKSWLKFLLWNYKVFIPCGVWRHQTFVLLIFLLLLHNVLGKSRDFDCCSAEEGRKVELLGGGYLKKKNKGIKTVLSEIVYSEVKANWLCNNKSHNRFNAIDVADCAIFTLIITWILFIYKGSKSDLKF